VRADGSVREAVAAVVRPPVEVQGHECIPLGAELPDHARCAVLVRASHDGAPIDFVATHLAWHPDNAPMARRLADELARRGALGPTTIVAGDLNASPESEAVSALASRRLHDARPDSAPTHFLGGRLDYVLAGPGIDVVRGIDRRASYERIRPMASLALPSACAHDGPPACPVSDHLPEAVVVRVSSSRSTGAR
jgi:endonuclease/exonuclease/phosphatase family metal-dependent hydrolase